MIISGSPVQSVPDSIKILDGNVISIWADPLNYIIISEIHQYSVHFTKDVIVKK
jgi:hypothetical protein